MSSEYEVGYKKPPRASRWAAGQSGNPRGRRPKKRLSLAQEAAEVMSEPQRVVSAGREMHIEFGTAVFRKLTAKAISGNMAALRQVFELSQKLESFLASEQVQSETHRGGVRKFLELCTNTPEEAEAAYQQYLASQPKRKRR